MSKAMPHGKFIHALTFTHGSVPVVCAGTPTRPDDYSSVRLARVPQICITGNCLAELGIRPNDSVYFDTSTIGVRTQADFHLDIVIVCSRLGPLVGTYLHTPEPRLCIHDGTGNQIRMRSGMYILGSVVHVLKPGRWQDGSVTFK